MPDVVDVVGDSASVRFDSAKGSGKFGVLFNLPGYRVLVAT